MRINDAIKTGWRGLVHSKTRTFLTMLGIIIGISSVILLLSIGTSAQLLIINQVQGVGSNLVFIIPGATKGSKTQSPASAQGIIIKTLKKQDVDSFAKEPSIQYVSPEVRGQGKIIFENNDATVTYEGVAADFFPMRNFNTNNGMPFTKNDTDTFSRVAVLGSEIANTLFGERDPVGKTIRLKDLSFRVIGVLEKKGVGPFGIDQDNLVVIPYTIAQRQMSGIDYFQSISLSAKDGYDMEFVKARINTILRDNHKITNPDKDDFTVQTQEDILSILGNITSIMKLFLTAIASISLVVGGIGIMNIMLVSVVERTREIGLRKAIGATNKDIMTQFLIESVMLTSIGGVIGILVGAGMTTLIYFILINVLSTGWFFALPISSVITAFVVSAITGIMFGIYPARQAAIKNPIDALRYE